MIRDCWKGPVQQEACNEQWINTLQQGISTGFCFRGVFPLYPSLKTRISKVSASLLQTWLPREAHLSFPYREGEGGSRDHISEQGHCTQTSGLWWVSHCWQASSIALAENTIIHASNSLLQSCKAALPWRRISPRCFYRKYYMGKMHSPTNIETFPLSILFQTWNFP